MPGDSPVGLEDRPESAPAGEGADRRARVRAARRAVVPWLIAAACFVALDRASLLFVPAQYRSLPDRDRYHTLYFSLKFRQFRRVRDRLDVVILGDSRARHGVDPSRFAGQDGAAGLTAFNFAPASSGVEFTDMFVRDYLLDLPRLRTVVWGASPRIFNRYWEDPVYKLFQESGGCRRDRLVRSLGWSPAGLGAAVRLGFDRIVSALSAAYAHRGLLKAEAVDALSPGSRERRFTPEPVLGMSPWGFIEFPRAKSVDVSDPGARRKYVDSLRHGRFQLAPERWERFTKLVGELQRRGVALVCFVPPMAGCAADAGAADADGTPLADYRALGGRLKALEGEHANFRFLDIHRAGESGFADADFADWDHLNAAGVARLSRLIDEALRRPEPAARPAEARPAPGLRPEEPKPARAGAPAAAGPDAAPPTLRSHLGDLDYAVRAYPPDNRPTLWADYRDEGSGIDVRTVRFFIDDVDVTKQCKVTPARVSYTPEKTMEAPKLYRFKVVVCDKAGNRAELAWEILLKPC